MTVPPRDPCGVHDHPDHRPGRPAEVARRHREYGAGLRGSPGFDLLVTVRVAGPQDTYATFVRWRRARDLLAGAHADGSADALRSLHALAAPDADPEPDQYLSVGRLPDRRHDDGGFLLLLHADLAGVPAEFEQSFGALVAGCARAPGFAGAELLRSTLRPYRYRGLVWWWDEQSCGRATDGERFREGSARLTGTERVDMERGRCVARVTAPMAR